MTWECINQRRFPRVNHKCRIIASVDERERVLETVTENIGIGGVCVFLEENLELFRKVSMEIYFEGEQTPIVCDGEVVWIVKRHPVKEGEACSFDTGIEFLTISDADKDHISSLVEDILQGKT